MRHKLFFLLIFFTGASTFSTLMGQGIENLVINRNAGLYEKKSNFERKPAPLPGIREADVTWSKTVWRQIDFREKMNQAFYFPTMEMQGRNSLFNVLMNGIKENSITAFVARPVDLNEFGEPISYQAIVKDMSTTQTRAIPDINTGISRDSTISTQEKSENVKSLIVK